MATAPVVDEATKWPLFALIPRDLAATRQLTPNDTNEALDFLGARPVHTAIMRGMIRRNGIASELNRGRFYGYYNQQGELEGVALIGAASLFETRSEEALTAFARLTRELSATQTLVIEQEQVELFWQYYGSDEKHRVRLHSRELLMQLKEPAEMGEKVVGLRQAVPGDLELIMPVHAAMCLEEKGVDPSVVDPQGFRQRCLRRIEQGQTWVWIENEKVIFKADVVADTPEAIYLEAVYVNPGERRKGYGLRCLAQMCDKLLGRTEKVSLLVDERNLRAQALYSRVGYELVTYYDTIQLNSSSH